MLDLDGFAKTYGLPLLFVTVLVYLYSNRKAEGDHSHLRAWGFQAALVLGGGYALFQLGLTLMPLILTMLALVACLVVYRRERSRWTGLVKSIEAWQTQLPKKIEDRVKDLLNQHLDEPLGDIERSIDAHGKLITETVHSLDQYRADLSALRVLGERTLSFVEADVATMLRGRFLYLDDIKAKQEKLNIFFSHKDPWPHKRIVDQQERLLLPVVIDDESSFVIRLWALSNMYLERGRSLIYCSCEIDRGHPLVRENMILVGSSKCNKITELVLAESGRHTESHPVNPKVRFTFERIPGSSDWGIRDLLRNGPIPYAPSKRPDPGEAGTGLVDYALITRIANPFESCRHVYIFAGCKAAGQVAIDRFLFTPGIMSALCKRYIDGSDFQLVMKTTYDWGNPIPKLRPELEVIYQDEPPLFPDSTVRLPDP